MLLMGLTPSWSCSNKGFSDRSSRTEPSSSKDSSASAAADKQPGTDNLNPPGYQTGAVPIPINGANLVEVLVIAHCFSNETRPCSEAQLSATIKVNAAAPFPFAADTAGPLGIKSSSWEFQDIPDGTSCQSTNGPFAFNPLCSGTGLSTVIKATLILVANDGSVFKGNSPRRPPSYMGTVQGNFLLVDASNGFASSGIQYSGATSGFTQIWQDVISGLYATNILYDGSDGFGGPGLLRWSDSKDLCAGVVNSGDGIGKWRLPTMKELCGANYEWVTASNVCNGNGGLYQNNIKNVIFSGGNWLNPVWSSNAAMGEASSIILADGRFFNLGVSDTDKSAICVRDQ